jgi:16S rRNA (guanine527-N7)-methyltransferase
LTAVKDPNEMLSRHVLDSLILNRWLDDYSSGTTVADRHLQPDQTANPLTTNENQWSLVDLVDIGSGAGLPVLPLAIVRPDLAFASIESNGKKTRFQQQVIIELGMDNVQIIPQRVQNVSLSATWITSRAFTAPADFLNIARHLCHDSSRVLLMLGQADKLPEPLPVPFSLEHLLPVDIPGTQTVRHIAVCRRD